VLLAALLSPLAFQLAGSLQLQGMYESFEERLHEQPLHTVAMPLQNITWAKQGKEIVYQGRLFDIKEMKISNGFLVAKGLFDDEEKELKEKMARSHERQHNAGSAWVKVFSLQFFNTAAKPAVISPAGHSLAKSVFPEYAAPHYISFKGCRPGKPPRLA
jgi:hypothetical protein